MMAHQATPMSRPLAIRPLGVLLTRIAHRESRVAQLREADMAPSVIQLEIEVLDSLKQELHHSCGSTQSLHGPLLSRLLYQHS